MRREQSETLAQWRELVSEQQRSSESVAAFCRRLGVSSGRFFAWRRRLRGTISPPQFVPVKVFAAERPPAAESTPRSAAIEVRLRCGRSLLVEPEFDAAHLRQLLRVLEA